jgi:hypothetical protein
MKRMSIHSGLMMGALAISVLLAPQTARAGDRPSTRYRALEQALGGGQEIGNDNPSLQIGDGQPAGFRNLRDGIEKVVRDRISSLLSSSTDADPAFRNFMVSRFSEAVQAEMQVTVAARLAEARAYLRQGNVEAFEDTLVALTLPAAPAASDTLGTDKWLSQWQAQRSWLHGNPERALALIDGTYQSLPPLVSQ